MLNIFQWGGNSCHTHCSLPLGGQKENARTDKGSSSWAPLRVGEESTRTGKTVRIVLGKSGHSSLRTPYPSLQNFNPQSFSKMETLSQFPSNALPGPKLSSAVIEGNSVSSRQELAKNYHSVTQHEEDWKPWVDPPR